MNIKQILIAATPLITLAAGYFGYEPIQELKSPPPADVDIEVTIPEQDDYHTHPQHKHKDWHPVILEELEKARKQHEIIHH